jgi:hypothetical protein
MSLDKAGNSNTDERAALLSRLLAVLPAPRIEALVADREFIGADFFLYLETHEIVYAIRIKENAVVVKGPKHHPIRHPFNALSIGQERHVRKPRWIDGPRLYLSGRRLSAEEFLIVATRSKRADALRLYQRRWAVEVLFAAFKSRGFDLEATHLTEPRRLETLLALLTLALTWALLVGTWESQKKPIVYKNHGRRAKSLFRTGLDHLQYVLLHRAVHGPRFIHYLNRFLTPGPSPSS